MTEKFVCMMTRALALLFVIAMLTRHVHAAGWID